MAETPEMKEAGRGTEYGAMKVSEMEELGRVEVFVTANCLRS